MKNAKQSHISMLKKTWLLMCLFIVESVLAKAPIQTGDFQLIEAFETAFQNGRTVFATIEERMDLYRVPGVSIAVLQNGRIAWAKAYGVLQTGSQDAVDVETAFSVGSISKVVAAAMTLSLVETGKLNLDVDVNTYLRGWKVPSNAYTEQQVVTLRHILSHTAGLNVHGFKDFQPGEELPSTLDILLGRTPAKNRPVTIEFVPGAYQRYSGGGTTVAQLLIEESAELSFVAAAEKLILEPLGMKRSTFENPVPVDFANIAKAHDRNGEPRALPRGWEAMPEMAASGFWTTPSDLGLLMIALIESHQGQKTETLLSQETAEDMMTKVEPGTYGLGPRIMDHGLFAHGGSNDSYKAFMMAHLGTGNGIVVFTNGANGERLGKELVETMKRLEGW